MLLSLGGAQVQAHSAGPEIGNKGSHLSKRAGKISISGLRMERGKAALELFRDGATGEVVNLARMMPLEGVEQAARATGRDARVNLRIK